MNDIWLDCNAHVPMSKKTILEFNKFNDSIASHGHPSSPSKPGREAARILEESRAKIANLIGASSPNQIIFTRSCTEACNWMYHLIPPNLGIAFISPVEHPASLQGCEANFGSIYNKLKVSSDGLVDFNIDNSYKISSISCIHVQNEIGTIQNIRQLKDKYPKSLILTDASQSLGKINFNVCDLQVDIAAFGGHKFGGANLGFLYIKDTSLWKSFGTGSRYGLDAPGTPDVGSIVATAVALEEAVTKLPGRTQSMLEFRSFLEKGLEELEFEIIGKNTDRAPNTTFVRTPVNALSLMLQLGERGVHAGLGSACGSLYTGGSPLMQALGRPSDGQEYMRFSQFGYYGIKEAEKVLKIIKEVMKWVY